MSSIRRLIPNLLTAGNLIGGILAITFTLQGRIDLAPYCIFISALFDFLDGFAARILKVQNELGKQLDSLADMVTFGVAPGIIVYELIKSHYVIELITRDYSPSSWSLIFPTDTLSSCKMPFASEYLCHSFSYTYLPYFGFIIPVFALFRLAKFNLDSRQSDSFIGVPTPAVTIFFAAIPLMIMSGFSDSTSWQYFFAKDFLMNPWFLIGISIILSVLMLAEIPLFALKFKHFKWKENELRFIFLTISIGLLATLFVWALPIIILLYIILSLINNLIKKSVKDEIQS